MALKKPEDSFVFGLLAGLAGLFVSYFSLFAFRRFVVEYTGRLYFLAHPMLELLTITFNILLVRYFMITSDREKTGKGILFVTVIVSFIYFYLFFRVNHHA